MAATLAFTRELTEKLHATSTSETSLGIERLVSSSLVQFQLGTGADIFTTTLIPAVVAAQSEVILVTCFWTRSKTLSALSHALETLALHRKTLIDRGDHHPAVQPLRIHICFSSRSLLQKLFHTSSRHGYTYPPSSWPRTLGLPDAAVLHAGRIELQVKSLFFLPFSVMHPKFLIIDRQGAFVPSCNVSWEAWLEGCVEISGPAVSGLLGFFSTTWDIDLCRHTPAPEGAQPPARLLQTPILSSVRLCERFPPTLPPVPTAILPSSHYRNPNFRPFPWQAAPRPPPTPLNVTLLYMIDTSVHSIYVQTPNLTCASVVSALLAALSRGVDVSIVTGRNMMLLEQLLTAGTTTSWCLRSLVRRYRYMVHSGARSGRAQQHLRAGADDAPAEADLEAQTPGVGQLSVSYFQPHQADKLIDLQQRHRLSPSTEEPVHSHLKLTIVDGEYTVLGSGNMDRASWFTSQELGILFRSKSFATAVSGAVSEALVGRLMTVFDSTA